MDKDLDIESVLRNLGYNLEDRGEYWQSSAVYRGGDNKTALQIYKNTGVWKDYVQETGFLPFKALIEKSAKHLTQEEIEKISKGLDVEIKNEKSFQDKIKSEEIYPKSILEKLLPHYSFYNERGISDELLKKLHSGLSTRGQMYQRYVFPIYNDYQQIIGFAGRDMSNKSERPKWKHVGRKTKWCYPSNLPTFCQEDWTNSDVFLVESIGDFLSMHENTNHKTLVTFGLDVSPALINKMLEFSPKKIFLSFNNDSKSTENRGLNASVKNYLKLLSFFDADKLKICLPTLNDFGDMNRNEYNIWEKKVKNITAKNQKQDIIKLSKKLFESKKISKSLYSNIKFINE